MFVFFYAYLKKYFTPPQSSVFLFLFLLQGLFRIQNCFCIFWGNELQFPILKCWKLSFFFLSIFNSKNRKLNNHFPTLLPNVQKQFPLMLEFGKKIWVKKKLKIITQICFILFFYTICVLFYIKNVVSDFWEKILIVP